MDFVWEDQYDAMAGPDRRTRRIMEEENKKIRKKARREYIETVRNLAEFVKKRDKRVIEMQVKRNEEMERKREEERARKKELEREKAERARNYVEPEWTKVDDEEVGKVEEEEEERKNELYCVACSKKFKSDKQWKNHEQSKKHKDKVEELRKAFRDEEGKDSEEEEEEVLCSDEDNDGFVPADDGLHEQFENDFVIQEEEHNDDHDIQSTDEEAVVDIDNGAGLKGIAEELGLEDDDETLVPGAMLSGHKSRKGTRKPKAPPKNVHVESEPEEIDLMEYNNRKGSRRNWGSRKERGKRADEDGDKVDIAESGSEPSKERGKKADENGEKVDIAESGSKPKEGNEHDEVSNVEEPSSSSHPRKENETDSKEDTDQS